VGLKALPPKGEPDERLESPRYVRVSLAAAMTMGIIPGRFFRDAKLYCINLLLTYDDGCIGRCAYCGLSRNRVTGKSWREDSFIRVDWPAVTLDEVISRMKSGICPHVERICVSMVTNARAPRDLIVVVDRLHREIDLISALITPTIVDKGWLYSLRDSGADMVGIAIDAATPELFEKLRGSGVGGPHRWETYWVSVKDAVEVFGRNRVGVHLIAGLGETEKEMVEAIQRAYDMGAQTHLFSFFPEEGSPMQNCPQPPIGSYRRIQLARYLINHGIVSAEKMRFDEKGRILSYGVNREVLDRAIDSGSPFMTSGCPGKTMENACNRPFANSTPYQAYIGELRNYPFKPNKGDIRIIRRQLHDYSNKSYIRVRV
jgi:biotin synthase